VTDIGRQMHIGKEIQRDSDINADR